MHQIQSSYRCKPHGKSIPQLHGPHAKQSAITPGGGLGAHIDARQVVSHIPAEQDPAGSLVAALYPCSGIRGTERGTLSQTEYVIDRVKWLYDHGEMIGGLRFVHEPKALRFFTGRLEPVSDWPEKLIEAYIAEFGEDQ